MDIEISHICTGCEQVTSTIRVDVCTCSKKGHTLRVKCHISEFISLKNYKLHNNWTEVGMMHTFLLIHARGKLVCLITVV